MSIPYIPGWGDTLRSTLPELGKNIHKVLKPHAEAEQRLKQMLEENPEKINEFIDTARTNPGVLTNIFGEKAEQYIAQQQYTPKEQQRQKAASIALETAQGNLETIKANAAIREQRNTAFNTLIQQYKDDPSMVGWITAKYLDLPDVGAREDELTSRRIRQMQERALTESENLRQLIGTERVQSLIQNITDDDFELGALAKKDYDAFRAIMNDPAMRQWYMDGVNSRQAHQQQLRLFGQQLRLQEQAAINAENRAGARQTQANESALRTYINDRNRLLGQIRKTQEDNRKITPEQAEAFNIQLGELSGQINRLGGESILFYVKPFDDGGWFGRSTPSVIDAYNPTTGEKIDVTQFFPPESPIAPSFSVRPDAANTRNSSETSDTTLPPGTGSNPQELPPNFDIRAAVIEYQRYGEAALRNLPPSMIARIKEEAAK